VASAKRSDPPVETSVSLHGASPSHPLWPTFPESWRIVGLPRGECGPARSRTLLADLGGRSSLPPAPPHGVAHRAHPIFSRKGLRSCTLPSTATRTRAAAPSGPLPAAVSQQCGWCPGPRAVTVT
jgi:hypothetical protein